MERFGAWGRSCRCVIAAALCVVSFSATAQPLPQPENAGSRTLLAAWLAFGHADNVSWPYAFITADDTPEQAKGKRQDLFDEFDRLRWRLKAGGYPQLVDALDAWHEQLARVQTFRVPGDWSPGFLLAHPNQQPPLARIRAIGICGVPDTVGVWSAGGYQALPWHSGMRLSDVESRVPATRHGSNALISVVSPYGDVDQYGVQAWNYADGPVSPGTQVVASLPLKGKAFAWIRHSVADLIAHVPSGVNCRQTQIPGGEGE